MKNEEQNQNQEIIDSVCDFVDEESLSESAMDSSIETLETESATMIAGGKRMLAAYLHDIGHFHGMSKEEEEEAWARRSKTDIENILNSHLRMVVAIVERISPYAQTKDADFMDLIQAGNMGLIRATKSFDPSRGSKFSTHAYYWISTYVRNELGNQRCGAIKKPAHVLAAFAFVSKLEGRLALALGRKPTQQELMVMMDGIFSEDKLDELFNAKSTQVLSMDVVYDAAANEDSISGSVASLGNSVEDNSFEEQVEQNETASAILDGLNRALSPKMRTIVCARYGLGEFKDAGQHTLSEVSEILFTRGLTKKALSQERIRQLEMIAIDILRRDANMKKLFN